jgi:hypothetical protein
MDAYAKVTCEKRKEANQKRGGENQAKKLEYLKNDIRDVDVCAFTCVNCQKIAAEYLLPVN